jgi:hypothetical protein
MIQELHRLHTLIQLVQLARVHEEHVLVDEGLTDINYHLLTLIQRTEGEQNG